MSTPQINNVHFVGSVQVPTAEECFRTLCEALPGRLKQIPDGEPGIRDYFMNWQTDLFKQVDPRVLNNEQFSPNSPRSFTDDEAASIVKNFEKLETQYDNYALESYATFKRLKQEGVIPQEFRFQVCLPTPVNVVYFVVHTDLQSRIEPIYEEAMLRSLKRLQDRIPHSELSIQWDAPIEIGMLEQANFYGFRPMKAWFEPVLEGVLQRMAKMVDAVAEDVQAGIHLCYGTLELSTARSSPFLI